MPERERSDRRAADPGACHCMHAPDDHVEGYSWCVVDDCGCTLYRLHDGGAALGLDVPEDWAKVVARTMRNA